MDGRTEKHEEDDSRFFNFAYVPKKIYNIVTLYDYILKYA